MENAEGTRSRIALRVINKWRSTFPHIHTSFLLQKACVSEPALVLVVRSFVTCHQLTSTAPLRCHPVACVSAK